MTFPSAYDFCVDRVISEVVGWSSAHAGGSKVGFVMAKQKKHEDETTRTFDAWDRHKVLSDKVGPLSRRFPRDVIPLQAADMIAHEVYRHANRAEMFGTRRAEPTEPIHPPCLEKITHKNGLRRGGYFSREDLRNW